MSARPDLHRFKSFDGVEIAWRTLGSGPPALLLHGFLADAQLNFFEPGIARTVADAGFQVIAPDLRGHGASAAPEDPAAYPPDVLALDQEALLQHLGIGDYVLAGYSLGARTAVRMLVRGAKPSRCALGGMGDDGVIAAEARRRYFEEGITRGPEAADARAGRYIQAVIASRGLKPAAMLGVLHSFVATAAADLARIETPTVVVCGEHDQDNGSNTALAALMPHARAVTVGGDHLTAVVDPALARAFADHLRS